MKSCPTCHRTYAEDTFTFCLDDGALLSAPYDPHSTLQIPAARQTDPPATEILRTPVSPPTPYPIPPEAKKRTSDPFHYAQADAANTLPQRQNGTAKWMIGGVIALLTIGVLLLGYLVWQGNQNPSEAANSNANLQTNNAGVATPTPINRNVNVNAGTNTGSSTSTNSRPSSQWLEGVWEGRGQQNAPKMSWSIKLTVENNAYVIEYPSLRCGGKWTLTEMGEGRATFKETITRGLDKCSNGGDITIEKISDSQISYKYTLPIIGEVATATLSKGAMP